MIKISIIIPCRNEENYITECLNSVVESDYDKNYMEVFVVDGMSIDGTRDIINQYSAKYPFIKLLINNKRTVPYALNMGIKMSSGEYIIRLDAHSEYPANYFSELIKYSLKLDADNIGTVCITEVKNKNKKTNSIKKVLSNKFGVGNSLFRIGTSEIKEVDTVPFGCYKRSVFDKVGFFNEQLVRDQDIELNKRIKASGGKIYLLPHVSSKYYARENFKGFAKNNYQTGLWNIFTVYVTKNLASLSVRHLIPFVFICALLFPLILSFFYPAAFYLTAFVLVLYLAVMFYQSLTLVDKDSSILFIFISFIVIHFSYGFGSLVGFFRLDYLFKE